MTVVSLIPDDEEARIAAVRRYDILDTPPDGAFDRIAAAAAELFGVPIAIVSIVDTDRIWFKAHHGLDGVTEIGRDPGLCASAILSNDPWIVSDAATDPRTLANPLVAGDFGLRFYAGIPLTTSDGHNLGTLCVIDRHPREVAPQETRMLEHLASVVVDQLELRLSARRAVEMAQTRFVQAKDLATALQRSLLPPSLPKIAHVDVAATYSPASRYDVGGDFYDIFPIDDRTWGVAIGDVCGNGPDAAGRTSCARYSMRAAAIHEDHPSAVLSLVNQALLLDAAESDAAGESSRLDVATAEPPFVTALFARLSASPRGASVTFAAGGHPLPTLLRADGTVEQAGQAGTLLGVFADVATTDTTIELAPGDTMVLVTDGVLDSGTPALQQVGLEAILRASHGGSVAHLPERIFAEVAAAQADDIAIVAITALG